MLLVAIPAGSCSSGGDEGDLGGSWSSGTDLAPTTFVLPTPTTGPPVTGSISDLDPAAIEGLCEIGREIVALISQYQAGDEQEMLSLIDQVLAMRAPGVHPHVEKIRTVLIEEEMDPESIADRFQSDIDFQVAVSVIETLIRTRCV